MVFIFACSTSKFVVVSLQEYILLTCIACAIKSFGDDASISIIVNCCIHKDDSIVDVFTEMLNPESNRDLIDRFQIGP